MAKYEAFYKGKRITVEAGSSYGAQKKAAEIFKAKHSFEVTVGRCGRTWTNWLP